jgi:hypothetical protein
VEKGFLTRYFTGCAAKALRSVEVDPNKSNQHEFNGVKSLRSVFGDSRLDKVPTHFLWIDDDEENISEKAYLTWYDSREKNPLRAAEYRFYFPSNSVMDRASVGDILFIARRPDSSILVIVVPRGSSVASRLLWLFGLTVELGDKYVVFDIAQSPQSPDYLVRHILEELNIVFEESEDALLDSLISKFGLKFPPTREFSLLARDSLAEIDPLNSPDEALLAWLNREESLFRRLERRIVSKKLEDGFCDDVGQADVNEFISFSLSVQNRRKSRAGHSLENHLEAIFNLHNLKFKRGGVTENNSKPDFLFPGTTQYQDLSFPVEYLSMLGSKTSCKDRWRQVLAEAKRIKEKHLITLQPSISESQTSEMRSSFLQLVVPNEIQATYNHAQQAWLISLSEFIEIARERQSRWS